MLRVSELISFERCRFLVKVRGVMNSGDEGGSTRPGFRLTRRRNRTGPAATSVALLPLCVFLRPCLLGPDGALRFYERHVLGL